MASGPAWSTSPTSPRPRSGDVTYAELGELARRQAAKLDELGIGVGERVADRQPQQRAAARRVLRGRRLGAGPGAGELPAASRRGRLHRRALAAPGCSTSTPRSTPSSPRSLPSTGSCSATTRTSTPRRTPRTRSRGSRDENATACINYTSGTTARPKGVQITHRNIWINATTFALHTALTDRDVYLHTLPMFHANGWGMPFATTGLGVKQVVIRKIDGAEILRRVERPRRHRHVRRSRRRRRRARGRPDLGGRDPRSRHGADHHGRRPAAHQDRGAGRGGARLGVHPDLRSHRDLAAADHQPHPRGVGRPLPEERAAKLVRAGAPAHRRAADDLRGRPEDGGGEVLARSNVVLEGYWDQPDASRAGAGGRLVPHRRRRHDRPRTATSRSATARRTSSSPGARTSPRSRSRTCSSPTRRWPRSP